MKALQTLDTLPQGGHYGRSIFCLQGHYEGPGRLLTLRHKVVTTAGPSSAREVTMKAPQTLGTPPQCLRSRSQWGSTAAPAAALLVTASPISAERRQSLSQCWIPGSPGVADHHWIRTLNCADSHLLRNPREGVFGYNAEQLNSNPVWENDMLWE